jgi:hypothetical protein
VAGVMERLWHRRGEGVAVDVHRVQRWFDSEENGTGPTASP